MQRRRSTASHKPGQKKQAARNGGRRWARLLLTAAALAAIWGLVAVALLVAWYAYDLPDIGRAQPFERRPAITLLYEDGSVLARYGDLVGNRLTVRDLPPHLIQAVLATEDRRFYDHFGIDLWGLGRAALTNLLAGEVQQGGSTITQQLAKNLFLTPERTLRRKVQEFLLALWLERRYAKDEILAAYLNRVYLGAGAYGVEAAAEIYFGKSARQVTVYESAILAGLLRAPSRYSPLRNPTAAANRARTVLMMMADAGYITAKEQTALNAQPPAPGRKPGMGDDARYAADWIIAQAVGITGDQPRDLVIRTSIDRRLQRLAEQQVEALLAAEGADHKASQAALVALGRDGAVRALVGGRDYDASSFNRATLAMRQPGSAFKPFVFLAALQAGMTPETMVDDAPLRLGNWRPENFDGQFQGPVTLRTALVESRNVPTIRLLQAVGTGTVIALAEKLGIRSRLRPELSLALGTSEVNLLELTTAYAGLRADGAAVLPFGIIEIRTREGELLFRHEPVSPPRVADETAIRTLQQMMAEVVTSGTGRAAGLAGWQAAGKTGTSQDYRDAWFVGWAGALTTGVWLGNDNNRAMKNVTGGGLPARLWANYMAAALPGLADLAGYLHEELPQLQGPAAALQEKLGRAAPPAGAPARLPDDVGRSLQELLQDLVPGP